MAYPPRLPNRKWRSAAPTFPSTPPVVVFLGGDLLQLSPKRRFVLRSSEVFLAFGIAPTTVADGGVTIGQLMAAGKSKFRVGHRE
jgi:hypothetical protein